MFVARVWVCILVMVCVTRSEDNFMELVLTLYLRMDSRDQTPIARLGWKIPLPTELSHWTYIWLSAVLKMALGFVHAKQALYQLGY